MSPIVVGAILCGGASRRFGRDKALAPAADGLLGERVVRAARDAGADPVVAIGGTAGNALGIPTVADRQPGAGPLAALATALRWARHGLVLVVPCDLPLVTARHLALVIEQARADPGVAAVATDLTGRPQPMIGCWPAAFGLSVQELVDGGERAWRAALRAGPWSGVDVPAEALADADTPSELESLLASAPPMVSSGPVTSAETVAEPPPAGSTPAPSPDEAPATSPCGRACRP